MFTRAFLTALRESKEVLDGQQLFTAVRRPVIVNANQTPEYSDIRLAGHDGGDFLFVPVSLSVPTTARDQRSPTPEAAPAGGESNLEALFWESIRESENAANFEAYLAQLPSGIFAALARNKLEELKATETAAVAVETPEIGKFDGEWVGESRLERKSVVGGCPSSIKWRITILNSEATGFGKGSGRNSVFVGEIDENGLLTGGYPMVYGAGEIDASYSNGKISGSLLSGSSVLACSYTFLLTKLSDQ